jgi:murein DD-endopeptidase MepM/ murein hydrolase activator NlpD
LPSQPSDRLAVTWHPARVRAGDVAWLHLRGVPEDAEVEGSVGGRPLGLFPYAGGLAALMGFDLETKPGRQTWRLAVLERGREPRTFGGTVIVHRRDFAIERLTVPSGMAELDPETERRAVSEAERLQTLYRMSTGERLWRGRWVLPVAVKEPGTGFGARRVINGKPRSPHAGSDYPAPLGTPVVAANSGRVALVGDYFFPGRLVVIDHGLGLYTLYFHLEQVTATVGAGVERGQPIGTVGATGRVTGPHLHFGVQAGRARVDPTALLALDVRE